MRSIQVGSADDPLKRAAFQQLEVDTYVGAPNKAVYQTDLYEAPILRMYGVTQNGVHSQNTFSYTSKSTALAITTSLSVSTIAVTFVCLPNPSNPDVT